jgi:hypothetical protein
MAETAYQKRTKVRRMSDIERLAREYSKNVESMTGQYQQSYAAYQKDVAAKMAPYETAVEQYKTGMANYETQSKAYKKRLSAYQKTLESITANPRETFEVPFRTINLAGETGIPVALINNKWMPFPPGGDTGEYEFVSASGGKATISKPRAIPQFTEEAPVAPTAPTKPEIAPFDQSQFETKGKELGETFQREVGERKAARLGAVSRRATRPMLQES